LVALPLTLAEAKCFTSGSAAVGALSAGHTLQNPAPLSGSPDRRAIQVKGQYYNDFTECPAGSRGFFFPGQAHGGRAAVCSTPCHLLLQPTRRGIL